MPLLGGAPRPELEHVIYADWSPTDSSVAAVHVVGSQQRLEFPIGTVLFQTEGGIGWPRVSPTGDRVAFLDWPVKDDDRGTVAVVDRKGGKQTISRTWEGLQGLAWTPDGDEVWYTAADAGSDYAIQSGAPGRPEHRVFSAPGGLILEDIAKDGKALIARYDRTTHVEGSFAGDPDVRDLSWLGVSFAQDISADGRRVLLSYFGQGASQNYDVYVRGSHDSGATRVGEGQTQQFSPDGTSVLAVIHGPPSRLVIHPIGPGDSKTVSTGNVTVTYAHWLPDGRRLLIVGSEPGQSMRAYVIDVAGSTPRQITTGGITLRREQLAISHDGKRAAFRSPDGAVTIYPIDGGTPTAVPDLAADEEPIGWTVDNRSVLILQGQPPRRLVSVDVSTGRHELVRTIMPSSSALFGPSSFFSTPDGASYVANYQGRQMILFLVEGLR